MNARARSASILGLAAVSGAAALVYEVAFFRGLGLALGVASHAVASVVGAFLFGLGLGAWLGGRWLANVRPLRAYAAVEATIALYGLAAPWLMQRARELAESGALGASTGVRPFVAAFVLLVVPTVCMGATFPLLDARSRLVASPWASVGWLYALNASALVGNAARSLTLLPALGLSGSTHAAVALNVALALAAIWLARGESTTESVAERAPQVSSAPAPAGLLALSVALIGAASLMLQVLANRLILSLLGGTVYVFAATAVFLFGLALGGALGGHAGARTKRPATLLGVLALAFALSVGAGIALLRWRAGGEDLLAGPDNLSLLEPGEWLDVYPASRYLALTVEALRARAVARDTRQRSLPADRDRTGAPTRAEQRNSGRRVYFWNTFGAIVGSWPPSGSCELGLRGGIVAVAVVAIVAGLLLLASSSARAEGTSLTLRATALVAALAAITAFLPRDPPGTRENLATVFAGDSAASSAKVQEFADDSEPTPVRNLRVNGKTVASSVFIDRRLQYLLGFVSTLSHPEPRKLLCIGLGTGMTSAAMAVAGGELTVVEISPAVIEAARRFSTWNEALHERDDVTIVADDGRPGSRVRLNAST
jgi:predicted membrane-bound spermidine synthase